MVKSLADLEKKLKIKFKDKDLLKSAFIHRSYLNEHSEEKLPNNERLEFLGDAILGLIVSKHLYEVYPKSPEGDLTNYRSSLVNAKILSKSGGSLGLGEYLYLSKGEEATGGRQRQYILANTFEALIGAIFLDAGVDKVSMFIEKNLLVYLSEIIEKRLYKDFKSHLQEKSQEQFNLTPTYKLVEEKGPDHAKTFKIAVLLDKKKLGEGSGPSKQEAQQQAAKSALEKWDKIH